MYSFVPLIAVLVLSNSAFINARTSLSCRSGSGCHGPIPQSYPALNQSESIGKYNAEYIEYVPPSGGPAVKYVVYTGPTPTYVYSYKNSGSKFGMLLAGLALLNLGDLSVTRRQGSHHQRSVSKIGEVCLFGVQAESGQFEETIINCMLVTSFLSLEDASPLVTKTNISAAMVPKEATDASTERPAAPNASHDSSEGAASGTTVTNAVNALDVQGSPVAVTRGMMCYVRILDKKSIPCEVLQTLGSRL